MWIRKPVATLAELRRYLQHTPGKRKKQYCSDACRMDWWNAHQDKVKRKAYYSFTCAECGKTFSSYGNAKRVYCSHSCYITARFSKREKQQGSQTSIKDANLKSVARNFVETIQEILFFESCQAGFIRPIFIITPSNYHTELVLLSISQPPISKSNNSCRLIQCSSSE